MDSTLNLGPIATQVIGIMNAVLLPVFIIIGGILVFKMIGIGFAIARAADDPERRRQLITSIIWFGIGLLICFLAPVLMNTLLPSLTNAGGQIKPGTNS